MSKINTGLLNLLTCPVTGSDLSLDENQGHLQLVNQEANCFYPLINGIPWIIKNPLHSMVDWSVKLNHFNQVLNEEIRILGNELKQANGETARRLQKLHDNKVVFLHKVTELVSPILKAKVSGKPIYDALSDRAPNTQNLLSYESNLYRDWVWGDEENELSLSIVAQHLNEASAENILVLGAGACRLAFDIHNHIKPKLTIANDINPLLMFAAQSILNGNSLELPEFPAHPVNLESVAVLHKIESRLERPDNFHLLISDALKPTIAKGTISTVVTPWLIDIQPFELAKFLRAINHYLPNGGTWINFGSLVFNQNRESFCYSIEEIKSIAQTAGFEIEEIESQQIPYLKSPYNAGYRVETVWSWRATKFKDCQQTEDLQNLPDWILDTSQVIPATKELQAFAFSHQMYADLASKIDGKSSIDTIAKSLSKQKKMDRDEASAMVKSFYLKIIQNQI
ncbi:MAG: hypothetical protein OQK04_12045 [Kangiellaceae bacterium]|nr:hypothetical protein [Kangiellaceae bacterium]MCW8999432.1 hypothetical protein [Kangiellaceae bacterium]